MLCVSSAYSMSNAKTSAKQPAPSTVASESVWVGKPDGAQSCGIREGAAMDIDAGELKKAGIPVLESKKGHDGKMHTQVCGAVAGTLNLFRIPKSDSAKAVSLGFNPAEPSEK